MLIRISVVDVADPLGLARTGYVAGEKIIAILPQKVNIQPGGKQAPLIGKEVTMVFLEGGLQLPVAENVETLKQTGGH